MTEPSVSRSELWRGRIKGLFTRLRRGLPFGSGVLAALLAFVFGNIMLLSFPEYLGLEKELEAWFFGVFGYLNLVLALPVLLYSARDYFTSAWTGLRNRHLNIDVPLAPLRTCLGRKRSE